MSDETTRTLTAVPPVVNPQRAGRHFLSRVHPESDPPRLLERTWVLGRSPGPGQWELDDRHTSRRHFEVARVRGEVDAVRIVDLGSKNGTFVDGARVQSTYLEPGSVIRAGDTVFVYEVAPPSAPEEPPPERGVSLPLHLARARARALAPLTIPALVRGPTGAGKEALARLLHEASGRPGALVAINCATLGAELLASELFGHVAGAFSGARAARDGLFIAAARGTLFLDEIAEMPLEQQPALLRALQERRVRPVGADRERLVDVRVIAATHQDLRAAVDAGRFRGDLYARLVGAVIDLPGLSARRADILPIFRHLLASGAPEATPTLTAAAAEALLLHPWPFNVRELQHAVTAALLEGASAGVIDLVALPASIREGQRGRGAPSGQPPAEQPLDREALEAALRRHRGNVASAARELGRTRQQLYRRLEAAGLDPNTFRDG